MPESLSVNFLEMYSEIFLTNPSFCSSSHRSCKRSANDDFRRWPYIRNDFGCRPAQHRQQRQQRLFPQWTTGVDTREVEDTFEVERIVHVQVDPEQRLAVVVEDFAVEFFIILIAALVWMFGPQRVDIADVKPGVCWFLLSLWLGETSTCSSFRLLFLSLRILRPRGCALRQRRRLLIAFIDGLVLCGAFALDRKISTGMKEQYFSRTSRTRYSFANSRQSSFRNRVISVPTVVLLPSDISYSVLPSQVQCTGGWILLYRKENRCELHLLPWKQSRNQDRSVLDHLIWIRFVFVFLQEFGSAGEGDLGNIFFDFVCGHTDTVIDEF